MTLIPKHKRFLDKKYTDSFKVEGEHTCLLTGVEMPDAAHVRHGWHAIGMKPDDDCIIPLAHHLHSKQHMIGEPSFWCNHFEELPLEMRDAAIERLSNGPAKHEGYISTMDIVIDVARAYYKQYHGR